MTSIDEVIARSRRPGEFSEHRRFTVLRERAIEKMREFGLVDPHYYILELIQSAVANQASFIDVEVGRTEVSLSYVGGSYRKEELAQLFDFLFASREHVENESLRLLAMGVNALMLFEPGAIVIESGDGTLLGTTRIVIQGRGGVVEVGQPDVALDGTFVRATGLQRRKVARRSALDVMKGRQREYRVIEERCVWAPVPLMVNGDLMFGASGMRMPDLMGYSGVFRFDEGDLYGSVGVTTQANRANFRLVTYGVWVETVEYPSNEDEEDEEDEEDVLVGGVVAFDRLRKTADHSRIVKDAYYEQMWRRVALYIERARRGLSGTRVRTVTFLDGSSLPLPAAMEVIHRANGVILAPPIWEDDPYRLAHVQRLHEALGFLVLCVSEEEEPSLRAVLGSVKHVVSPDFRNRDEIAFYSQPIDLPPARPWLLDPVKLPDMAWAELPAWMDYQIIEGSWSLIWKANGQAMRAAIDDYPLDKLPVLKLVLYTQINEHAAQVGSIIKVRVCGRVLETFRGYSKYEGQVLVIDVPDVQPSQLSAVSPINSKSLAALIAYTVKSMLAGVFKEQGELAIKALAQYDLDLVANPKAAEVALNTMWSSAIVQLHTTDGQMPLMAVEMLDQTLDRTLLDRPMFETLTGERVSVRGLARLLERGSGLIYAVDSHSDLGFVELRGLDRSLILKLSRG